MAKRTIESGGARGAGERGVALPFALFALMTLLVGSTGALLISSGDIQASRNYRGAQQVHFVAESGLTHALQNVNAVGVVDFQNEVVDNWGNFLGSGARNFPGLPGYQYAVTTMADPAAAGTRGWIISAATGPEGVRNTAVARVEQSNIPGTAPGAVYLANDNPTNSTFRGNNFGIDGNDHNYDGTPGPGDPVPGIATRNQTNSEETVDSLGGSQLDNVQGLGYQDDGSGNVTPSVLTAPSGPSVDQINTIVDSLVALGEAPAGPVHTDGRNHIEGNAILGTEDDPQIYHFIDDELTVRAGGTISGAGILIIDGDLSVLGTLDWLGLIIVRGETQIGRWQDETTVTGDATIYGSLWTNNLNMVVGGSGIVNYSTQALALADQVSAGGVLPAPLNVLALVNCQQVASGVDGCP